MRRILAGSWQELRCRWTLTLNMCKIRLKVKFKAKLKLSIEFCYFTRRLAGFFLVKEVAERL
jgi:ribosome-associated toxin RatA of RatAB toxin-antitoxin module